MKPLALLWHDHIPKFMSLYRKLTLPFILVILLQFPTSTMALGSIEYPGNETDHVALLAIKSQLVSPQGEVLSSWNRSLHHCYWEGVTCGLKHNRVIELDLNSRGLAGIISPFIGNLSFIRKIELYNNSLHGQIPPQIGRLSRLQELGLENNTLVGEVPANISACKNLRSLLLSFNKLVGELPKEFSRLSMLQVLSISRNNFTGPLFKVIANLTSLQEISVTYNAFRGTLPSTVGRMRNLTTLYIGENLFSGLVPSSIFNLSSLQAIEFSDNYFKGNLPMDMGLTLPRLERLNIAHNYFTGPIPVSISNLTNIGYLGLDVNSFTGRVPDNLGHLHNVQYLAFSYNNLEGDINFIDTLVNSSRLDTLDLRENDFTGILPNSLVNLSTTLTRLGLTFSQIRGEIPAGITNLVNLIFLVMGGNEFTGPIPHDIGKLQRLEFFSLHSNRLTGEIPSSVGNLSRLSQLYLDDNKLQGSIPPTLATCQNLLYIDMSSNDFSGTLSSELFEGPAQLLVVDLSHNNLEQFLPLEIGKQTGLVELYVHENKLSGEIPDTLGKCSALQSLHMEGNIFHGSIPPSFTSLRSLKTLDLSRNNLSGSIPEYFSKLPLVYLNLSHNNFEGRVPTKGVLANGSAVSLVGNSGLCGGNPKLHLQRCKQPKERKKRRRMSHALKVTIPTICSLIGVLIATTLVYLACRKKSRSNSSSSTQVLRESFARVSYNMLLKATDGFSSEKLLGSGTFGSVFRGVLDGKTVAVKVLHLQTPGASKSFMAECKTLRNIRHRNLVGIITACSSIDFQGNDFKALVYEFMPNESLDRWLHEGGNLTLLQRLDIAIHVACALNYLHNECDIPIVHCDLKPSNVLLDNDMVAHVGDFGLAKFIAQPHHPNQISSIGIRGSVGYAAPEYGLGREASSEGDLYSYGVLLLEVMTGKRPTDSMFKEEFNLHTYAEATLPDQVLQIIDPSLADNEATEDADNARVILQDTFYQRKECITCMVDVGVACSKHLPQDRMRITDAISKLTTARNNLFNVRHRRNFPAGT